MEWPDKEKGMDAAGASSSVGDDDDGVPGSRPNRRQKRRAPRKVTPDYLERAALYHLERYASSAANLKRVLMRKAWRSEKYHGTDTAEAEAWIDALVARFCASGLLDDGRYAESRAMSLHRRGDSRRAIRQKLAAKGLSGDDIDKALDQIAEEAVADPELVAAVRYVTRRRLGAFRRPEDRKERRDRDLAALARVGFSYALAKRVIDSDDPDGLVREEEQESATGHRP